MDTVAKADPQSQDSHGADHTKGHSCSVPGYLQLADLAMLWQCQECGETWAVVADRRAPGWPLEFMWVRDPIQPVGSRTT
jgi:hypothetical protein